MKKILFATQNWGKLKEVSDILNSENLKILSLIGVEEVPLIIEDGKTFEENAKIKARAYYNEFRIPVLADDSGLEVEQLLGAPGVISARYAGEDASDLDNNTKLLGELEKYPEPHNARFVCCAVYFDGKKYVTSYGHIDGKIIKERKGENGFGYDPHFVPDNYTKTTAELSLTEKNQISHRAKAFRKLKELIDLN